MAQRADQLSTLLLLLLFLDLKSIAFPRLQPCVCASLRLLSARAATADTKETDRHTNFGRQTTKIF